MNSAHSLWIMNELIICSVGLTVGPDRIFSEETSYEPNKVWVALFCRIENLTSMYFLSIALLRVEWSWIYFVLED